MEQAPAAVHWLCRWVFSSIVHNLRSLAHATPDGLLLGREGAHSRWRVLHAGGDATGAEIERALTDAIRMRSSVEVFEETFVQELLLRDGLCTGLRVWIALARSFLH